MILRRAVLRLAVMFTAIQLAAYAALSVGIYAFVTGTFDYDAARSDGPAAVDGAEAGFAHLRGGLVLFFLVQLALAPALSYLMARRALRPVRANLDAQQRFVDSASHEFRTPLSVLQADIELTLSRPRRRHEYERTLQDALTEVTSLTTLTADLLVLARNRPDELAELMGPVDLPAVVRAAASHAQGPGPHADVHIEATHDVQVRGSRGLLLRAVANLLENALLHTPPEGAVTIRVDRDTATATVSVIDTGTGMTATARRRALEPFWRGEDAASYPGHGLGLTIVAQIVAAHRGHVSITETEGGGTTVTLTLPR